ncbi:MAG: hypothetical protein V3V88_00035 [Dehalococcoidia bacterium]
MAYVGSTAASSAVNPPRLVTGSFHARPGTTGLLGILTTSQNQQASGGNLWTYVSTNASTSMNDATNFTDGWTLGMRPGDIVMSVCYTSGSTHTLNISVVTDASSAGVTLSTGSRISSSYS